MISCGSPAKDSSEVRTRAIPPDSRPRSAGSAPPTPGDARAPAVGDQLFGFHLRQELGQGAFARVFLASQVDLAGRPVVLKISGLDGDEPHTLAQLQHTHIVPIHSVHEDRTTSLRAVCMPYLGGASLASVLEALGAETTHPTHGAQLARALDRAGGSVHHPDRPLEPAGDIPRTHWSRLSYFGAVAWLVARLAEGLEHAHQRGVLHRDIKPSNILLGADGQPMLLDFNVAQSQRGGTDRLLGGTVAYMAPEHLQALEARAGGRAHRVDRWADIYSLGMVLFEMLAGSRPFDQGGSYSPVLSQVVAMALERSRTTPSVRGKRADVPWALESIVRKCLAPEPAQRYQQAEHLAEDLRRFLEDGPLKYAPELSRAERLRKWARRHPRLTSSVSVAAAAAMLLAGAGLTLTGVRDRLSHTRQQLQAVQAQERKRAYQAGHVRALCLVNTTTDLPDHLRPAWEEHLRQGLAVGEQTLGLYGVLERPDWQQDPGWQALAPDERRALAEDTRELLLLLAWARSRTAPTDRAVLEGALALLSRAEAIQELPPARALWEDRAGYLERLGDTAGAQAARATAGRIEPSSARDHYLLATTYARSRRYAEAVVQLDRALALNPRDYWSAVQRGICHLELGKPALAAADFGVCIGLWPEFAWGYFNRGYALEKTGGRPEAINDYSAALERDPGFLLAYLNRGMARLELKAFAPALADFDRAAELGCDAAALHAGRGVALEGLKRFPEADAAFRSAFERTQEAPDGVRTYLEWVYGFAVSARRPEEARRAFETVLRDHPRHPQALYGRGMLLAERGQETPAVALFTRALEAAPDFAEPRRFRAVLQARQGHFPEAAQDINRCLEQEPEAGANHYAAACVAALAAEKATDEAAARQAQAQALAFLEQALARGYGRAQALTDPDLKGIRRAPEFLRLLQPQGEPLAQGSRL